MGVINFQFLANNYSVIHKKNRVGSFLETENSSTPNNEIEKNYFGNFITIACWLWRFASLNLTNVDSASSWDVSKITSPPE